MAGLPRVLLVDDDASIRALVALALEDQPLALQEVDGVPAALRALEAGPVQLVITDLMMPGQSGFDLLATLQARPDLRAGAKLAAFSAGVGEGWEARLQALGVQRVFAKPMAVQALVAGVRELLGAPAEPAPAPSPAAPPDDAFAGDAALRRAFVASWLQQWPQDLAEGQRACAARDAAWLRRVAHNLKGSLRLLGEAAEADQAWQLERACAASPAWPDDGLPRWAALATALQALAGRLDAQA